MRYLLHFEASIEAGARIDRSPGGPGPAIGRILDLLKPEAVYVSVFQRELFMIVNTDDVSVLSEAAHLVQLIAGTNLDVTPVMTGNEAMVILPPTIDSAVKATAGMGL